jgi:hypothetical protein
MLSSFKLQQRLSVSLCLVLLLVVGVGNLFAQATTATISGDVVDQTGAAVPAANVQVKNVGTGVTQTTVTDAQGRYTVPSLVIGNYEITVSKTGFQTVVRSGITLTVNQQAVIDVNLPIGQSQQTVEVQGQVSQVETASSTVANLVEAKQMTDLPLNGRNFQQLITLAPGVNVAQVSATSFYGKGETYSVAGSRPEGQAFLLDGTDVQNFFNRGAGSASLGTSLGMDAVAEFQTLTNTYSAQFPGNGAVVNAVTKSGTNSLHGSIYEYFRNDKLDARQFFDPLNQPAFTRNQFGGAIGGALKKDKLFYFGNYEGLRQHQGVSRSALVPTNAQRALAVNSSQIVKDILALYPLDQTGTGRATSVGTEIGNENYYLGRMDYNMSDKDSLFGRFVLDKAEFINPFSNAGAPILGFGTIEPTQNIYYTMEEKHIFSPTMINVARASFVRTKSTATAPTNTPALRWYPTLSNQDGNIAITGLSSLGPTALAPYLLVQNKYGWSDDVYWTKGAHNIKFGVGFNRIQTFENQPFNAAGTFTFGNGFASFLAGAPTRYAGAYPAGTPAIAGIQASADAYRSWRELLFMPYINDDWKVNSKLTINIGVRWDFDTNPKSAINNFMAITNPPYGSIGANASSFQSTPVSLVPNVWRQNPSRMNFNPRFGFAYDPFKDHKTSIRGGFGIFHNTIMARTWSSGYVTGPPFPSSSLDSSVAPINFPNPYAGGSVASPRFSNGQTVDYNTNTSPYQMQWNINIQRELIANTVLTVGYVGSKGVHLLTQSDQNPPQAQFINGQWKFIDSTGTPFPRWAPQYDFINALQANGNSKYNSMQVNLVRRFSNNFQAQVAYTWSKSLDDGSGSSGLETGGGPRSNPYDFRYEWGPSTFDIRQALRVNGIYRLPFKGNVLVEGWQINGIMSSTTAPPVTVITGFDRAQVRGSSATGSFQRPNLVAGRTADDIRLADTSNVLGSSRYFDVTAFSLQAAGTLGNLGRNVIRGVGLFNLDISVVKDTKMKFISESAVLQFRAEAFNILNHVNFAQPNGSAFLGSGLPNPNFGAITAQNGFSRQIQMALRLNF